MKKYKTLYKQLTKTCKNKIENKSRYYFREAGIEPDNNDLEKVNKALLGSYEPEFINNMTDEFLDVLLSRFIVSQKQL